MAGTCLEIAPGIVGVDPASNLKALWVGLQSFAGSRLVSRSQLDDMAALEPIFAIQFCIPTAGAL